MITRLLLFTAVFAHLCSAQTFEVASIRASQFQSADGESNGSESIETSPAGLTMRNVTLRTCIGWAYRVQDFQIAGDLGVDRFDIAAKAPAPATVPALRAMLGALLAERFKLAFHREGKDLSALDLVVARGGPKPNLRSSQVEAPGILRPSRGAMVAQHASMQEFIGSLSGPLRTPVIDKTGLTGRYDFTVDLSSYFAETKPDEQPDLLSVMSSGLRDQLGLALERRKEPVEVLVVDHADKKPSEN
ncbi:MAG TPA: TIGR03435 family protein [Bryobacteraceae bacterium]|jgi:uncharacterized protein (TIGR03435 family)